MGDDIGKRLVSAIESIAAPVLQVADATALRRLLRATGWTEPAGVDVEAVARATTAVASYLRQALEAPPDDLPGVARLVADLAEPLAVVGRGLGAIGAPREVLDDLAEVLLVAVLARAGPLLSVLELLGVAEPVAVPALQSGGWRRRATTRASFRGDRLAQVVSDPLARLRALAADPAALVAAAWPLLIDLLAELDIGAETADTDPADPMNPVTRHILVVDLPVDRVPPQFVRLAVGLGLDQGGSLEAYAVASPGLGWQGRRGGWEATVTVPGPQRVALRRSGIVVGDGSVSVDLSVRYRSSAPPALRFGAADGTSLTVGRVEVDLSLRSAPPLDVGGRITLRDIVLNLAGGDGDSFLAEVLPSSDARPGGDLALSWSLRSGLQVEGRADLDWQSGPVRLAVVPTAGGLSAEAGLSLSVGLGPVTATVERVGVHARLAFPGRGGNLGPAHVEVGFRPPSGVGLVLDTAAVSGGGFLFHDASVGQYAGAVHLEFQGFVLNAVGMLTTRLPGGQPGFSLLVIITAQFEPVQLGFGFALTGVGGLVGINRTVGVEVLRAGLRTGALDAVLLMREDPVPKAGEIVARLADAFPVAPGQFVLGPVAQLTWGTPPVVWIDVALLVQLPPPVRLVVLGRVRVRFPPGVRDAEALVRLNLDVLGVVDFGRREAAVDAILQDSTVMRFAISGAVALRATWGEAPNFTLAVGGFHPRYQPPPGFPALERVNLSLATGDKPRLRLEAYLAVTANTVQFGANVDLSVAAGGFTLELFLGFDALVQLSPFWFTADIAGRLVVKQGGEAILTAAVQMTVAGPAPWYVWLKATFKILGFSVSIEVESTFGERALPPPPPTADLWPLVQAALSDPSNWSANLPGDARSATVRPQAVAAGTVLAHPLGPLAVEERVLPLGREVDRLGVAVPRDERYFAIASVAVEGTARVAAAVRGAFAPAQYWVMSDAEKLAAPSFEQFPAGARLAPPAAAYGSPVEATVTYDTVTIGPDGEVAEPPAPLPPYAPSADLTVGMAESGPAAQAPIRRRGPGRYRGPRVGIGVEDTRYVVASRDTLGEVDGVAATGGTYRGAVEALRRRAATRPSALREQVVVTAREVIA